MTHKTKTREQVLAELDKAGTTVTDLAKEIGVPREAVSDLLHGRHKGRRGVAHDIAVYLNLKSGSIKHLKLKRRANA